MKYVRASFLPNLIVLKTNMPIILQETMFTMRKELWLIVQVAIFFCNVNWKPKANLKPYLMGRNIIVC